MVKNRARLSILYHISQFALACKHGDSQCGASSDWHFNYTTTPIPGDLVALRSAALNKWHLSWLVERTWPEGNSCETYLLESIEDGELCNWSNVSLLAFNRQTRMDHLEWRWTDEQYAFNDRWRRACYKKRDAYIYLPTQAEFDGTSVTIGVRVRFGMTDARPIQTFPNWKRVTVKQMLEFYDGAVAAMREKKTPETVAP